ncbi:MAG: MarR family winged helix-turn-helix transcriptional regulator [Nitrososphaeraceae archaeon]
MGYDDLDWFTSKMMLDYDDENLADLLHQERSRRREMQIMRFVNANQSDGIHHLDLARKMKIDRKNLTPYMKRLMMKGLVIRGNGKQGKYYPTTKKNRDISVTADLLCKVAAGTILAYRDFPIDSPYFSSEIIDDNDNYSLDNALFMFSNGIGAIITYLLIKSMDRSYDIPGRNTKNDEEKDINVSSWFKDGMSTLGVFLLALFKEYIALPLTISSNNYVNENGTVDLHRAVIDIMKHRFSHPSYVLDKKSITSLMNSFSRMYPTISTQMDRIQYRLPVAAFWETNHLQYERISYWHQKKCRHMYTLPSNKSLSAKYENLLHCSKCHKSKYIKNPF